MKTPNTQINIGGLFRCCLASLDEQVCAREEWDIGSQIKTSCCNSVVELQNDGVWRWTQEQESKTENA